MENKYAKVLYGKRYNFYKFSWILQIFMNFTNFHEFYKFSQIFWFFQIFMNFLIFPNFDEFFQIFILSEWKLIENATFARGESWESVFLKSILSIGRVLQARVLWTVWTSASGKCFPRILPERKSDILRKLDISIWVVFALLYK